MEIAAVNLAKKLSQITDHWHPHLVGDINAMQVKLVKLAGEFDWHYHDTEDELFLVLKGTLLMRLRDQDITVGEGEFIIIPHGVEHLPVAEEEVHLLLVEPATTLNTGTVRTALTHETLTRL